MQPLYYSAVLRLDLPELRSPGATVLAVGAHADDIEIGAGGTLLRLRRAYPDARLLWVVCAAAGDRAAEARAAAAAVGADGITILDLTDRFFPESWGHLKRALAGHAAEVGRCDLVVAPARHDRHQDHHTVADLVWQCFRGTAIWSYEIVKFEGDLRQPNLYVPLTEADLARKITILTSSFTSQRGKAWFDDATFRGLARVRGVECGADWAEAFHAEKMVW